MRQTTHNFWSFIVGVLVLGLVMIYTGQAEAWGGRHHHHRPHRHHHGHHYFFGLYYGYPYRPYYYQPYYPGEHRRLPAFRLPAFFHYPGGLGKDEGNQQTSAPQVGNEATADATGQEIQKDGIR